MKTVHCGAEILNHCVQGEVVQGRCLVVADGATSKLATELGYCTEPPKGICSRAFVEGGTHNTNFDGERPEGSPSQHFCSAEVTILPYPE